MDFHRMKRKQLQALCKKHKIPANLSNLEMANKLTEFLKEKEDPKIKRDENVSETESTNVVVNRKVKKVRFSPENQLIEFTRSREMKRRSRRNSVSSRNSSWSFENADSGEMNKENVSRPGRITRFRGLKLMEAKVNEKKSGIKAVQCNDTNTNASAIEIIDNGELKEGDVDSSSRVMPLRGKMMAEGVKNASKRARKRAKHDDRRDGKALDNIDNEKLIEEIVDNPGRLTRSRAHKLTEASATEEKRGRNVVKNIGNVALVRAETDDNRVASTSSFRNRGDVGDGKLARGSGGRVKSDGKGCEEVLENEKIAGVSMMIEPQIFLRRSKRKANKASDSEILNDERRKHENGEIKGLRKTSKLLAAGGSGEDAESIGSEVNMCRRVVLKTEEPIKAELRRSNRRKNVIESHEKWGNDELKAENENRYPLRSSVPELGIAGEVSKDDKKVLQPTGVMRRSRRKTSSLKLASADEQIDTDSAVENLEAEKHVSKPCPFEKGNPADQKNTRRSRRNTSKWKPPGLLDEFGGDSIIHPKNEVMKRKRGPISGGDVIKTDNDASSVAESMKESRSKKAAPAAGTRKVAEKRKRPCRLNDPSMLDAPSNHDSLEIRELLSMDAQLSVSEGSESTSNSGFIADTSAKNIISDVGLTSSRKTRRKKQDVSILDNAGSSDMKLIDGKELANSDTIAASRITELKTDSTDSEDQISASNIRDEEKGYSLLEFDVQELIEQNITNMDKNDPEAQMFNQTEDSSCVNTIDNQVLPEGSNVSGNEGFAETGSAADSLLPGDQTDIKTDLEVAEAEADKRIQPSPRVVDHVGEVKGISVQENLDSVETRQGNDISSPISCQHIVVDHLEASSNIPDNNDEDTSPKAREVGAFESFERRIDYTHSRSALKLKAPSSGMLSRREGDNMAAGNETIFHKGIASEVAETNEDGCLNNHKIASNQYSESGVPDLSNGERSARIMPQDRGIFWGEYSIMNSDEQGMYKDSLAVAPITIDTNSTEINLKGGHEADHTPKREETYTDMSINSHVGATVEGGSSKGQNSNCDEDGEFSVSNLFDAEGRPGIMPQDKEIFSGEYSINDFDKQGMFHGSTSVAPTTMCNYARDQEADLIAEGDEAYIYKDNQSELIEADEGGCLKTHKTTKDDDWEFSVSNLFDGEKSTRNTPQDRGIVSAEYSIKGFNEEVMFHDFPAVFTTFANCNEVKFWVDGSNLQEISPSNPDSVSESQAEQPKSPLTKPTTVANTIQGQEAWSNASEMAGHSMSLLKTNAEGKISQVIEGFSTDEDANDANCGKDKEDFAGACITDVKISMDCTISKIGVESLSDTKLQDTEETEQQCKHLLAGQTEPIAGEEPTDVESRQSWTEIELHNLFGTSWDDDTPGLNNDSSSQGTEIANQTMSTNKLIANNGGSLTKKKKKEMEGERRSGCAKTTNKNVVLPTNYKEVSHTGPNVDREDYQLKSLFATPIKIVASCKIDETYCHDRKLDRTVMSFKEWFDTLKENAVTQNKSDEKMRDAGYELENSLCLGDPLSDNGEDVTCEELNEVERVELVNASTTILSEPEYDGCEASKEQLTENTGECLNETHLITEEDKEEKVIPLGLDRTVMSFKEWFDTLKENAVTQNKSDEKMRDAGYELENSLCLEDPLSDNGEDVTCEELNEVESVELVNASTTILSEPEYDGCEASKEQLTENTGECLNETHLITVEDKEEKVIPLGQSCLYDEATDNDRESTEKNIISSSGSPRNIDKLEGCQDILIDTDLSESLSRKSSVYLKSEEEMKQSNEAAFELSEADLQKSNVPENSHHLTACSEDGNILRETSFENFRGPLDAEVANNGSFNGQKDVIDKGTSPCLFSKASPEYDEVTQRRDSRREDDDPYGAKIWDETDGNPKSSQDISDEPHTNSEVAILKSPSIEYNPCLEADKFPSSLELESTCMEAKVTGTTTQNVDHIVAAAEHGSSVCGAVSGILSSSAMRLDLGDHENGDIEKLELGTPVFNLEGDHEKKNGKEADENSTANMVQFSIQGLHFEEKVEDLNNNIHSISDVPASGCNEILEESHQISIQEPRFEEKVENINNDIHTISDVPASGCNEILKESDVADTIKEYIDSESSLSVIFENSSATLPVDILAHTDERTACENAALCKYEEDIAERFANSEGEVDKPSVDCLETECKELEEAKLFMEPASRSGKAVKSPAYVDYLAEGSTANKLLVETKGSAVKLDSQKQIELEDGHGSSSKQLCSTVKKNARTILIHGTPGKLLTMADMKENEPTRKSSNVGDFTTVRPAKRRALQDVQWK